MSKAKLQLDERERAMAVMIAAGRAARLLDHVPAEYIKQLAALYGTTGDIRAKVITILRTLGEENKATVHGVTEDE